MSDALYHGRRFRTLNILDEGVREALAIDIDTSLPSERVVRVLEQTIQWRGIPKALRMDNGPEFISQRLVDWCERHKVQMLYIQPGKPNQNAFIERFNRSYRTEVLDAYLFENLAHVRALTQDWLVTYNTERPHKALGYLPPAIFRAQLKPENSSFELSS